MLKKLKNMLYLHAAQKSMLDYIKKKEKTPADLLILISKLKVVFNGNVSSKVLDAIIVDEFIDLRDNNYGVFIARCYSICNALERKEEIRTKVSRPLMRIRFDEFFIINGNKMEFNNIVIFLTEAVTILLESISDLNGDPNEVSKYNRTYSKNIIEEIESITLAVFRILISYYKIKP